MYFVYLLLCGDGSIYTGITLDPEKRFKRHSEGDGAKYTRSRPPVKFLRIESYTTRSEAAKREHQIKGWRREKKVELIETGMPL